MKSVNMTLAFLFLIYSSSATAGLLTNPGFEDADNNGSYGDGWGLFGSAGFHAFFGPDGHASFFMDNLGNFGGVFQSVPLADAAGMTYQFDLLNVRIENNAEANLTFGLEYYLADDSTSTGTFDMVAIPIPPTGDGLSFSMTGTAPAGTQIVRPIILFDNVTSTASDQKNAFVFEVSLTKVPEPASLLLAGLAGLATWCGMLSRR